MRDSQKNKKRIESLDYNSYIQNIQENTRISERKKKTLIFKGSYFTYLSVLATNWKVHVRGNAISFNNYIFLA